MSNISKKFLKLRQETLNLQRSFNQSVVSLQLNNPDVSNLRFAELCSILDAKKRQAKADKGAILTDANSLLNQLCLEAQKLKKSNEALQVSLKNFKAEKVELMDKKVRLKAEKDRMEKLLR